MEATQRDLLGILICTKCEGAKEDTGHGWCTECRRVDRLNHRRSKEGVVATLYAHQKSSSKTRGHRPPEYTKQELQDWLFSQTLFHELYDEWVQSEHKSRLKPSVDRKCDGVHYCMRNITLMTWGENNAKGIKENKKSGVYNAKAIEVFKGGKSVGVFDSVNHANRELTGIGKGSLIKCLKKGTNSKGYTVLAL